MSRGYDDPKVTQMLDADWGVAIEKRDFGPYVAWATGSREQVRRSREGWIAALVASGWTKSEALQLVESDFDDDAVYCSGFTPGEALTGLAYKVLGDASWFKPPEGIPSEL